jgi:putative endonuclease
MKLIPKSWFRKAAESATVASFGRRRAAHLRLGERGERVALRLLRALGHDVLATRFRGPQGEVDIVTRDGACLCFVEVKTRHRVGRARPGAAVGREKQRRLIRTARLYLREIGHPPLRYRYDVVEVVLSRWRLHEARHVPEAFTEETARRRDLPFPAAPEG